ncbi:MAG: aminotransferase class V-fold PLP-dependent enzyme [Armatimonadota bacterium]
MNLPVGSLTQAVVDQHARPLFSRVLSAHSGTAYLANHSLGRPLDASFANIARGAEAWADQLDSAWSDDHWMGESTKFRSLIAQLLGLSDYSCVVPKTSAGQGLRAVLNSFPVNQPINVVATRGEFDSADFILKAYIEADRANVRWVEPSTTEGPVPIFDTSDILAAIDDSTDLVAVSAVMFGTGQVLKGIADIVAKAHQHGALVLVDTYHALGVFPFSMADLGADFCVGGCYKYLRGGPGSCFLAIAPHILSSGRKTLDTGWFAKRDTFKYERLDSAERGPGGDAWLESTPPVLVPYQAVPGLEFTLNVGVERIRTYTSEIVSHIRETFLQADLPIFMPKNADDWGAFALLLSDDPQGLSHRLKNHQVNTDARGAFVRFGPDLLTTDAEIEQASAAVRLETII